MPAPDLVVVGNVCRRDNPEARAAIERGLPYTSFPARCARVFLRERRSFVVAGTHGKTTTSALLGVPARRSRARARFLDRRRTAATSPRAFARRAHGSAVRDRGRRVRQRVLREESQVLAVPARGRDHHVDRARPHRHLSRRWTATARRSRASCALPAGGRACSSPTLPIPRCARCRSARAAA